MPAIGTGWEARRLLAGMTAAVLAVSLMGLMSDRANAQTDGACYEEVTETLYRYEKQQAVGGGSWVRAPENLQWMGPDEWLDSPASAQEIADRPPANIQWVLGEPGTFGGQWYRYVEITMDETSQVEVECPEPTSGWVCVDGQVEFVEDVDAFEGDETIYDTEAEAAADPACVTTTTVPEETTTTTTVAETTTTFEDEVLDTTVTTEPDDEASGTDDEVIADELPFTGPSTGGLAIAAAALASLGMLVTLAARRIEE